MSKATFYEHFANKEECILALFDEAATEVARARWPRRRAPRPSDDSARAHARRRRARSSAMLAEYPDEAQTLLVEIIGAGPRAAERRDAILDAFAAGASTRERAHAAAALRRAALRLARRRLRDRRRDRRARLAPAAPRQPGRRRASSSRSIERLIARALPPSSDARSRGARGRDRRLPALPAAGRVARAGRAREARGVRRTRTTGAGRSRASATRRARVLVLGLAPAAHGAQPHRPRLHRRPLGRLPVRRAAPHRLRQPADVGARATTACELRDAGSTAAVRCAPPANKPTPAGARQLPALDRCASSSCCPTCASIVCLGAFAWDAGAAAARRARRAGAAARARASATAPSAPIGAPARCSAASTPASRTRSPAS